jgi:hypothetical protein
MKVGILKCLAWGEIENADLRGATCGCVQNRTEGRNRVSIPPAGIVGSPFAMGKGRG